MKDIKDMNLAECLDELHAVSRYNRPIIDRIHDLTRWIPVSERLPTKEDGDSQFYMVQVVSTAGFFASVVYTAVHYSCHSHWQRITPPEGA
jgi:hypothetical protein